MAGYGRKTLCHFLQLDLRFRNRVLDPFEKKSTYSQLGFLFVDLFTATCVNYDTRYGKKLSMVPYGKEPVCQFFSWVLYITKNHA